jgi:hypothetical protein
MQDCSLRTDRQVACSHQLRQAQQGAERDPRFGFLRELLAGQRVEHPPRHGDL